MSFKQFLLKITKLSDNNDFLPIFKVQLGLEYQTRSDFGWSKAVPLANGLVFEWFGQNGCHFVRISNGFVRFSNGRFSNGRFQYIDDGTGTAGTDHSKSEPSQYRT